LAEGVKPTGFVGAMLEGGGKLVPQALPNGALAQLRFTIGYSNMMTALKELAGDELDIPEEVDADVMAMLDGSVALGVCAPKGGMVPQIFLTLGLADAAAFDRVMAKAIADGYPVKNVTYEGVQCTLLQFPDMPAGIQPAYCRIGNALHVAESGLSMRAFLKAQKGGAEAMDVGDAKVPSVPGQVVPTFDARFDVPLIYRNFYKKWLPIFEMTAEGDRPLTRDDMPDPDEVDEYVGAMRGVGFRDGNRLVMRHSGAIGPALAAYLMIFAPMGSSEPPDRSAGMLADIIGRHKMRAAGDALSAFEQREKRLPRDLAELFFAEKLPGDALLMPMDPLAETIALPDGQEVKSSFRYFRETVDVGRGAGDKSALLIEIAPSRFGRVYLTVDRKARSLNGEVSERDIEEFGM